MELKQSEQETRQEGFRFLNGLVDVLIQSYESYAMK